MLRVQAAEEHVMGVDPDVRSPAVERPGELPGHADGSDAPWPRSSVESVWSSRWLAAAVGVGVAAVWGVVAGVWTPRGPLTTVEVLAAMGIGLLVGATAGMLLRSRWAMLWSPVVFVVVFELARVGIEGPTVDRPAASAYGLLALAVGRGFHGVVALAPMVLGAALGAGAARRLEASWSGAPVRRGAGVTLGRVGAAACGFLLIVVAALVARPASTDAIVGADGDPLPGSIAELTTVEHDGHEMGLMLRGASTDAPVVLFLAGGPGGAERGAMRNHLSELEQTFVVATWDQRGTGVSYPALDPTSTLTLDSYVDDTIAVTNHLRERFDQDRIYVMGQSWGTTLGVLAVQRAPELYRAFIGTGQMVSQLATDTIFYEDTLAWAGREGRDDLADQLRDIGPPPYEDMLDYETALSYEHQVYPYDHSPNAEGQGGFSENFLVPEHTLTDQVHLLGAFMDTFSVLYPQLQSIDFRDTATELDVPVFVVQGSHEADGRAEPFAEWFAQLEAPIKDLAVLRTSGHRPLFEQPDEFVAYMNDVVLARTGD